MKVLLDSPSEFSLNGKCNFYCTFNVALLRLTLLKSEGSLILDKFIASVESPDDNCMRGDLMEFKTDQIHEGCYLDWERFENAWVGCKLIISAKLILKNWHNLCLNPALGCSVEQQDLSFIDRSLVLPLWIRYTGASGTLSNIYKTTFTR